jgi:hypothetical protein
VPGLNQGYPDTLEKDGYSRIPTRGRSRDGFQRTTGHYKKTNYVVN